MLGASSAPVTLQVFADLEDNDSKRWFLTLLPAIISAFVRTNILKIEYRAFKTNTIGSETFVKQQTAALAAGAQDKLWNYADTFYHEQGKEYTPYVTESYIDGIASQIPGLNIKQWHKVRNDGKQVEEVVEEDQEGRAVGIHVTPAYRLGRAGGPLKNLMGSEAITFPNNYTPPPLLAPMISPRPSNKSTNGLPPHDFAAVATRRLVADDSSLAKVWTTE